MSEADWRRFAEVGGLDQFRPSSRERTTTVSEIDRQIAGLTELVREQDKLIGLLSEVYFNQDTEAITKCEERVSALHAEYLDE